MVSEELRQLRHRRRCRGFTFPTVKPDNLQPAKYRKWFCNNGCCREIMEKNLETVFIIIVVLLFLFIHFYSNNKYLTVMKNQDRCILLYKSNMVLGQTKGTANQTRDPITNKEHNLFVRNIREDTCSVRRENFRTNPPAPVVCQQISHHRLSLPELASSSCRSLSMLTCVKGK